MGPIFNIIRSTVRKIPYGRVSTYANVAQSVGISNARVVGWALCGNLDKSLPCHRVVQKGGTLSPGFSLGGWQEQRRRLTAEGLKFSARRIQNFSSCLYNLTQNQNTL